MRLFLIHHIEYQFLKQRNVLILFTATRHVMLIIGMTWIHEHLSKERRASSEQSGVANMKLSDA
jgi:hypothetical protein